MQTSLSSLTFLLIINLFIFNSCQTNSLKDESENLEQITSVDTDTLRLKLNGSIEDTAIVRLYLKESNEFLEKAEFEKTNRSLSIADSILKNHANVNQELIASTWLHKGRYFTALQNADSTKYYYQKSLDFFIEKNGFIKEKIDAYNGLATSFYIQRKLDSATVIYEKGLKIVKLNPSIDNLTFARILINYGNLNEKKGLYDEAMKDYQKIADLMVQDKDLEKKLGVNVQLNMGIIYYRKQDFETAISKLQKAKELAYHYNPNNHKQLFLLHLNLGSFYLTTSKRKLAIENWNEALNYTYKGSGNDNPTYLLNLYLNLGIGEREEGQYFKSINYFQKSIEIGINNYGNDYLGLAMMYFNLGNTYKVLDERKKSNEYFEKAIGIYVKNNLLEHENIPRAYNSIGNNYEINTEFTIATEYYEKALNSILTKKQNVGTGEIARSYMQLGSVYRERKLFDKSFEYLTKALNLFKETYNEDNYWIVKIYGHHNLLYWNMKKYDKALYYNDLCLKSLNFEFGKNLNQVNLLNELLNVLGVRYGVYESLYNDTDSLKYLTKAKNILDLIFDVIDKKKESIIEYDSKQSFATEINHFHEDAIRINLKLFKETDSLHYFNEAYTNLEQGKALLIREAFYKSQVEKFYGVEDSLIEAEQKLTLEMTTLETIRFEEMAKMDSPIEKDSITTYYTSKILDKKNSLDSLQNIFEKTYPEYYHLNNNDQLISLKDVRQKLLEPNQVLLEYLVGDTTISIFVIKPDTFNIVEIQLDFPLKDWVKDMRKSIENQNMEEEGYINSANNIFKKIFFPIQEFIPLESELIIVPDGELSYLPFEALISEIPKDPSNFRAYKYLLQDYIISYAFSSTSLAEMKNKVPHDIPSKSFAGFAPIFENNDSLILATNSTSQRGSWSELKYNIPEVKEIQRIIRGDVYTGSNATEKEFSKSASNYKILHLSTHGEANDHIGDFSYLAFYKENEGNDNGYFYNRELYNLRLNADMVVLSACETGIGELKKGEGIISLARGFSYAGAKSIITTLWSIDDQETPELMKLFYKNLKAGMAKDAALRQAKLDFLKTSSPEPYYWAAFIPIGDMQPIEFNSSLPWWTGVIGFIVFGVLSLFIYKKVKK